MNLRRFPATLVLVLSLVLVSDLHALSNRVFVSARSGSDTNSCDNIATPCQTFAGAVAQLNPGGDAIVLDSGGYGSVTITKALTIEAPPGVLAFIHPASGAAVTINAGASDTVVLRGLVLNGGTGDGIVSNTVGRLSVEDCQISGFASSGIHMAGAGSLNVSNTDVTAGDTGISIGNSSGAVAASIDHCHLDGNSFTGFIALATISGTSTTTVTNSTANNNRQYGWLVGTLDVVNLEFSSGSENQENDGFRSDGTARYSNCVFSNNGSYGVFRDNGTMESRGNNTITGNGLGATGGLVMGSFPPR